MGSGGSDSGIPAGKGARKSAARSGTVGIERNDRLQTFDVRNFSGNDGMVEAMDFGTTFMLAPESAKLDVTQYDFVISGSDIGMAMRPFYGGQQAASLAIGVKLATPQGVSAKQQDYAKSVLGRRLGRSIAHGFNAAFRGEITVENAIQQVKELPKMSAREILDKWARR